MSTTLKRYFHIQENEQLDEARLSDRVRRATQLPGECERDIGMCG
jgi:hypothetical protein